MMTGDELKDCLDLIGWTARTAEHRFGTTGNTIQRMINGDRASPENLALWARTLAAVVDALGVPRMQ